MIDTLVLDAIVRGVAVGGFATIGVTLAVSRQPAPARWIGAVFFLAAIGHVVDNCAILRGQDGHVSALTRALSIMGPGMFWAFALTLFADERPVTAWRLAPTGASLTLVLAAGYGPDWCASPLWAAYTLVSIALVTHALLMIWRGWRGDLVEPRRRLRAPVMGAAAIYVLATAAQDMGGRLGLRPLHAPLLQAVLLAALAVAGAVALLRPDPVLMGVPAADVPAPTPRPSPPDLDLADRATLTRLNRAMDEEQIWRREDLSVRALADHVAVPEHRLRRLINGALGHRNFAAFVNARRIEAAKRALTDPGQARKPVSAIAYDLGFGSLGTFNRAFKDATGMTPTAWRQGEADSPNPEKPLPI
jgi:AraC-like DNA-binding protein